MQEIRKRDGTLQPYRPEKIQSAVGRVFAATQTACAPEVLQALLVQVEETLHPAPQPWQVEDIQDAVEKALMQKGFYEQAKRYILYRQARTNQRLMRQSLVQYTQLPALEEVLAALPDDFSEACYALELLHGKFLTYVRPGTSPEEAMAALIQAAMELTSPEAPRWEFIAARLLNLRFTQSLAQTMQREQIGDFYEKVRYLTQEGLYGAYLLEAYSRTELLAAAALLRPERDKLFTYAGLDLLLQRYVIHDRSHVPLESPQEMYLGIALHLAMREPRETRLHWVEKFYDMLSLFYVTMATPTLSNARKPYHQMSSCFIDVVPDSLEGIYHSIDHFAQVSKFGGGMGLYFGKVRAAGSSIRGFEGAAGGVIRWIRLVNDTAVAVDQLGMRQGAVAVYLDAWHHDLPEFLQLRTNNGDDRMKAHDVFPALCYPDLFWRLARDNRDAQWALLCPHEVLTVKGYALEDFYGDEWEQRYQDCLADPHIRKRYVPIRDLLRLILKSAVETGTPFAFNRDTVNHYNPNGHAGMIYSSNLCTEIAQNMAPGQSLGTSVETEDGDPVIVHKTRPGDFVVCNLASLSLGYLPLDDTAALSDIVATVVRALDNVIDLNFYPLPEAADTCRRYRSIGLGVSGYHHMLARTGLPWESQAHLDYADRIFETINYAAISASCALAAERGSYARFSGSDWDSGAYFDKRNYTDARWQALREKVHAQGLRNAYLLCIAPTSSTSILSGTTAGIDPVMNRFFLEEKKGAMLPRVAPSLSMQTFWLYKNAHLIDQNWSIRACGVRQRHIDQSQSMNLYITNEFTLSQVLSLYLRAWEQGVKTLYYVRSKSLEVTECESCSS